MHVCSVVCGYTAASASLIPLRPSVTSGRHRERQMNRFAAHVASSRIFTRMASKNTTGYIGSRRRLCQAVAVMSIGRVVALLAGLADELIVNLARHGREWYVRRQTFPIAAAFVASAGV